MHSGDLHALQPTFIKGKIYDSFNGGNVSGAVITTTKGYSEKSTAGSYVLRLPPNVYDLMVSAPGYRSNMLTGITTAPGQTETVDFWLSPASTITTSLQGRVVRTSDLSGIPSALVASDLGGVTVTDYDGYYRLLMPTGTASVTAVAHGMQSRTRSGIQVARDKLNRLVIPLSNAFSGDVKIIGSVRNFCTGSRITRFSVYTANGDTFVSRNGSFEVRSSYGSSILLITAPGYQFTAVPLLMTPLPRTKSIVVDLVPSRDGYALISGTVFDSQDNTPVSNVRLETNAGDVTFSEDDGSYSLYASRCANTIMVIAHGYEPFEETVSLHSGEIETIDIQLSPQPSVSGSVYDDEDGRGLPGVLISCNCGNVCKTLTTDNGTYRLDGLSQGECTLTASRRCYDKESRSVSLGYGSQTNVDFALSPLHGGTLNGEIQDAITGKPLPSAIVRTDTGLQVDSDLDGFFSIPLPACPLGITFSADGYVSKTFKRIFVGEGYDLEIYPRLIPCSADKFCNQ